MELLNNLEVYLQEIMRNVAASLMVPVMIVLVCLILFAVYSVGALIAEYFTERRHFKANMPRDIKAIKDSTYADLPATVEATGLLRSQKEALKVIVANMGLPEDDLFALAKAEVSAVDARYRRKVARTDLVTKIAPMMGLMCTLIPLGPGIVAMGQGEVNLLSNSLLVAFDGTVAGLIGGVVSMIVSSIRKRWYANYLVAMESLTTCVLEKAEEARFDGVILPYEGDIRAQADAVRSGAAESIRGKRGKRRGAQTAQSEQGAAAQSASSVRSDGSAASVTSPTFPDMDGYARQTSSQDVRGAISTLRNDYAPQATAGQSQTQGTYRAAGAEGLQPSGSQGDWQQGERGGQR